MQPSADRVSQVGERNVGSKAHFWAWHVRALQFVTPTFNIDIQTCPHCQGRLKIIACIDDPAVIQKILTHLSQKATAADPSLRPLARAPPA